VRLGRPNFDAPAFDAPAFDAPRFNRGDASAPVAWSVDATSGWAVPASSVEWRAFLDSLGLTSQQSPGHLHLCQEPSGNLADSIGTYTLAPNAAPAYGQTIAGWTRKAVAFDGVTASQRFMTASGPNASVDSILMFAYVRLGAANATIQQIMGCGIVSDVSVGFSLNTVGRIRYRESANITDTAIGNDYQNRVTPIIMIVDHGGARARLYTDREKLSPGYGLPSASTQWFLGAAAGAGAAASFLYAGGWNGSDAEIADADVKLIMQGMIGASVPWS